MALQLMRVLMSHEVDQYTERSNRATDVSNPARTGGSSRGAARHGTHVARTIPIESKGYYV